MSIILAYAGCKEADVSGDSSPDTPPAGSSETLSDESETTSGGSETGSDNTQTDSDNTQTDSGSSSADPVVVITPVSESVDIKDEEIASYDFTKLFSVTSEGAALTVDASWIDVSALSQTAGSYEISCDYGGASAKICVNVLATVYDVQLSLEEITLNKSLYETYDFKSLFTVLADGENVEITDDMIETDLRAEAGSYTYTVTVKGVSKTLKVQLTNEHDILIVNTYPEMAISETELADFDYTKLFSLYVDGVQVKVTADMIDASALADAAAGNRYAVSLAYTQDDSTLEETAYVNVKEAEALTINAKNVVTYPNGEFIDLTTLFEIRRGEEIIPVTDDMITGSIDYTTVGENQITLEYEGEIKTAVVEVKRGVIINYKLADTIVVKKGTDMFSYSFANDFVVTINGIRFTGIDGYIDTTEVDFDTVGEYTATLTIPYNEKTVGLSGVKFDYIEAAIRYVVVEKDYELSVNAESVRLPLGTTEYNVFGNLKLTINGKNQTLTQNKDYVDVITCYAELLSDPIDFNDAAEQEVCVAVYVNGTENDPVTVRYTVQIQSDIVITPTDKVVYAGQTLFTTDLFTVTEGGTEIEPTYEMITGKADVFTPGVYLVDIDYKGVKAQARVVVLDNAIKGVYHTELKTIVETSNDTDEEYGTETTTATTLEDLVIDEDGKIAIGGRELTLLNALDENTLLLKYRSYEYTMYISDGIVVLDPDNSIRLSYNNDKRPMVYFDADTWTVEEHVTINYGSTYVLQGTYAGHYSIDAFRLVSTENETELWYGLNVLLVDRNSADTVYSVSWGEVEFAEDFVRETGAQSSAVMNGTTYKFTMTSATVATAKRETAEKKYTNMTFTGTIDGAEAKLYADQYEGFSLYIGTEKIFGASTLEISEMKNGGVNYAEDTVFFYDYDDAVYSYKFVLDVESLTFTVAERDGLFGKYETDGKFIFLDGYGTGVVSFDTSSYYTTQLAYSLHDRKLDLRYVNTTYKFQYGTYATLFIDPFMNVLTAADFADPKLNGTEFVNSVVTNGAIVRIHSYKVGAASDSVAKAQLYSNIEIVTKDGALDSTQKKSYINTSCIRFNTPGFYQMIVTVDSVQAYYTIQVLEAVYADNALAKTYGAGVLFPQNSFSIDQYGQATINVDGTMYSGNAKITEVSDAFLINASCEGKAAITLKGERLADGLVLVRCTGGAVFNDYFTTNNYTVSGTSDFILRGFAAGERTVYVYSKSETALGEIVTVESLSDTVALGAILKITATDGEHYVKLLGFSDVKKGLEKADAYRGAYTVGDATLTLDGFGNATLGTASGAYTLNGRVALVTVNDKTSVYRLDNATYTAALLDIKLDNSLVNGKTFGASYYFTCDGYMYLAETTFEFGDNGVVTVRSTSSEHDNGEDACTTDLYAPDFASASGVAGTYSVNGNKLTVTVAGKTFVFVIGNVVSVDSITCETTTAASDAHGYFSVGTVFENV
ncbi:MAG: hypothetical protein IJX91_04760 [Clostridia bacterium]|nr:hypothetical protein [Clostridia bacterium]